MSLDTVNWPTWLQRWDVQQTGYLPDREARFNVMLDVLDILMPAEFVELDLACVAAVGTENEPHRFRASRTDESGDREDFAPAHIERHIANGTTARP